ncbi:MAG: DUF21 domain-containing protein [Planctomycetes bacterium]|nr:DUF21 domain-containing protein [Planctomycetota bacterium]
MVLLVLGIAIALGVSFICSLMEATLLSLRPSQIADITQHQPAIGRIWENFKTNIERPIGVILILNTAAHTIGATVAGAEFDKIYGDKWIWLSLQRNFLWHDAASQLIQLDAKSA